MRDYAQYTSRIPSPRAKMVSNHSSPGTSVKMTRNVSSHPLASPNRPSTPQDKREKESVSSAGSYGQRESSPATVTPTKSQSPPAFLNASDAMMVRKQGSEATIFKLRQALEDANAKDATAKAALAKSDAVILELRSSLRSVKEQLEILQGKQGSGDRSRSIGGPNSSNAKVAQLQKQIQELQAQLSGANSKDAAVGELQVQLDRAHAQILTADMVRKELEDTLEAEQYTWELRVQDQEREIEGLRNECERLSKDLEEIKLQQRNSEEKWENQVSEMQQQLTQARTRLAATQAMNKSSADNEELHAKIRQLETERTELQNCLDETFKELEAVDAELKEGKFNSTTPQDVIEQMQHLLRWVYQEGPAQKLQHTMSKDPKNLLSEIQKALEKWLQQTTSREEALNGRVAEYQEEIKSREESTSELRESLKEAVALLKPLQEAVATAEEEKRRLQTQLQELETSAKSHRKERVQERSEIEKLKAEIAHLEQQVEEQRSIATARGNLLATASPSSARTVPSSQDDTMTKIQRAREELRRKRETEGNLQQLLRDAQLRFKSMHQQNEDTTARNRELQGKLQNAETRISSPSPTPEDQLAALQQQLKDREAQVVHLQEAMERNGNEKVQQLDKQLEQAKKELLAKDQAEKVLNKSLKDALGLLKPLQTHLEEAEREKMDISKELRNLRKRFRQLQMAELGSTSGDDMSRSTFGGDVSVELIKIKEELEETVRQLELENSQLHDALEDVSENGLAESKLRQKLAELNSRYEVTQNKLEDAHVENHSLQKSLKQKVEHERKQAAEIERLQKQLEQSESELDNAKSIARTALIKVEELTMSSIEEMSRSRDGSSMDGMKYPLSATSGRF